MDINSLFSAFSLVAVYIYLYIGIYTMRQNKKSAIHKIFLLLCISYGIWSFAYAFAYCAYDNRVFLIWNKISAIGWCSFGALSLYLVLLITENKWAVKKVVKGLIFLPAFSFFFIAVFLSQLFYIGQFWHNFIVLSLSIACMLHWGIKSTSVRIKKQAFILVVCSVVPFILNLLTQDILPKLTNIKLPFMGQLYAVIMILGIYRVITKYKFLKLPEQFIFEEITTEMLNLVIVLNEKREMIRVSPHILELLGLKKEELLGQPIEKILHDAEQDKLPFHSIEIKLMHKKHHGIHLKNKAGDLIPVQIISKDIFDSHTHDFLGVILVIQDMTILHELQRKNEELQEKAIRDSLTKLYNHQYAIELLEKEVIQSQKGVKAIPLSLMMMDIDYFKDVNDTYGHPFGDYVLETISGILTDTINDKGHVGRFGGEEFIGIFPQMDIEAACQMGEQIKEQISHFKFDKDVMVTVSIGIKELQQENYLELIKGADALLYKAKQNGRDAIEYSR
jgi:diguanylate cyclase (GGDEF)-like protein/PAS domain S-box-containing protein